jgi:hypothetical protein
VRVIGRAQTFDGYHFGAIQVNHFPQAGTYRFAIHDYGTSTALSFPVTRLLGSGEPQVFSQKVKQDFVRFDIKLPPDTIYGQGNLFQLFPPFFLANNAKTKL